MGWSADHGLRCLSWPCLYVDCMEKLTCIMLRKINACEVNISLYESEVLRAIYFDERVIKPGESCGF